MIAQRCRLRRKTINNVSRIQSSIYSELVVQNIKGSRSYVHKSIQFRIIEDHIECIRRRAGRSGVLDDDGIISLHAKLDKLELSIQ